MGKEIKVNKKACGICKHLDHTEGSYRRMEPDGRDYRREPTFWCPIKKTCVVNWEYCEDGFENTTINYSEYKEEIK